MFQQFICYKALTVYLFQKSISLSVTMLSLVICEKCPQFVCYIDPFMYFFCYYAPLLYLLQTIINLFVTNLQFICKDSPPVYRLQIPAVYLL